jgi:hypothetical protein
MKNAAGNVLILSLTILMLGMVTTLPASADTIAYSVPLQAGNQAYTGSLGLDFNVNSAIYLTGIGVFDPNAVVGSPLAATLSVAIYDRDTQLQIPGTLTTFSAGTTGPLTGANLITDFASYLELAPGHYSVVAWGYNPFAKNGNANMGPITSIEDSDGGLISFVGTSRFGNAGAYPTIVDGGPTNRYLAGTFSYEPVPEPATFMLVAPALIGLAHQLRRK